MVKRNKPDDQKPSITPNRRQFITSAAAIAGSGALLAACGQESPDNAAAVETTSKPTRRLKLVTTWPKNFPGMGTSVNQFAERVRVASGGSIDITVYGAGELVPALSAFDAVSQGNADMYHGAEYYWQGKSKAFNFFAAIPFGMTGIETSAWIHSDGGQELWDELSAQFNIKPFFAGTTGVQMGGWFTKEINNINDIKGLRMRIPGLGGEVISRLGGTPVTMAGGEIFLALSQGNIDATEWVGPWNDLAFGFHEITKNYYYPGFHEPGTCLSLGINQDLWNSFDEADKSIIEMAIYAESHVLHAEYNAENARALIALVEEHGVKLRRFPDDLLDEIYSTSITILDEISAEDEITARVYDSYKASMDRVSNWESISEIAYSDARWSRRHRE